jgi:siroheme synthase
VVRLKGGDPLLFGRAAEEMEALRAHHIPFEIVPGISAAFASAAATQISLTDRRIASRVLFTTYSRSETARSFAGIPIAADTTVVVYMPGPDYVDVSGWLIDSGLAEHTPCLVVSKASQADQAVSAATLSTLAKLETLPAPALLIVGRVASYSDVFAAQQPWLFQMSAPGEQINGQPMPPQPDTNSSAFVNPEFLTFEGFETRCKSQPPRAPAGYHNSAI